MAEKKTVRSSPVLAAVIRLVLGCGALLPLSWARTFGRLLGNLCARLPLQPAKVAGLNLKLSFPEMPEDERRRLLRRNLEETGKTFMEVACLWHWSPERLARLKVQVVGEEIFERSLTTGKGTLLLAPHLGNWELLNTFLSSRFPLLYLYRPPRIAELDAFVRSARGRTGAEGVMATPAGLRPLLRRLRSGRAVLLFPDQEPLGAHGVHAPFFGVPALTMTLVRRVLDRTGAEPLFVFAERRPAGEFRVHFREAPDGLDLDDPVRATTALNQGLEDCVRQCPEQYLWSYKRFLTAPPGEPTPYRAIWSRRRLRRNPFPPPATR